MHSAQPGWEMKAWDLTALGVEEQSRAAERLCPSGAEQLSVIFPDDTFNQLTRGREWSAFGFSQRCEIWAEGGSGLEGWRKILLFPKEGMEKFLMKKCSFIGGSGRGGKKPIKGVMKRKQNLRCFVTILLSPPPNSPKQSQSCIGSFKHVVTLICSPLPPSL